MRSSVKELDKSYNKAQFIKERKIKEIAKMYMMLDSILPSIDMDVGDINKELDKLEPEERRKITRKARKIRKKAIKIFLKDPSQFPTHDNPRTIKEFSERKPLPYKYVDHSGQALMYMMYYEIAKKNLKIED